MKTIEIFNRHNKKILKRLIPDKSLPIICNSVLNPETEIYNLSFDEIKKLKK